LSKINELRKKRFLPDGKNAKPAVLLHARPLYYYTHTKGAKTMKKETGYRITVFEVTVKHANSEPRKYLAQDLVETLRDRDEIKAVRARVQRVDKKQQQAMREAHEQMQYALAYIRDVRVALQNKLIKPRAKVDLKMWSIDLIDDLWLATNALGRLLKK